MCFVVGDDGEGEGEDGYGGDFRVLELRLFLNCICLYC